MANTSRDTRDVQEFSKIDLQGAGHIALTQGREFKLTIEAEDHILEYIISEVEDDTLILKFDEHYDKIHTKEKITYDITMPIIEKVSISGGGNLTCERIGGSTFMLDMAGGANIDMGTIAVQDFELDIRGGVHLTVGHLQAASANVDIRGSGKMTFNKLEADCLNMLIRGACNLTAMGRVPQQKIIVPGVGNINLSQVQSEEVAIDASGTGNITVWARQTLDVQVSGFGNVRYYGTPDIKKRVTGFGRVKHIGDSPVMHV